VIAVLGLHRPDQFAFLGGKHRIFKRLHHDAAVYPAQVAAILGGSGVVRVFLRQLREIGAITNLLQQLFGKCLLLGVVLGIRLDQDVAHLALLVGHQFVTMRIVIFTQLGIRHVDLVGQRVRTETDIGELYPLRHGILVLM